MSRERGIEDVTPVKIAIVGAGLAGLGMASALREAGIDDFVILEREDDLGGTWRDNTYPGCACDIPSVLYCYAGEPNPDWSHVWAGQAEIRDYIRGVARRHDVDSRVRCGEEVLSAAWVQDRQRWAIETTAGRYHAELVIAATGALVDPAIPALAGLEAFGGRVFHSARWDHDHDLRGRRVAVIGTGASAIQFVPEIQPLVRHLDLFQRTPPWVLPRANPAIPPRWRRRFARHPRALELARGLVFSVQELLHHGFRHPVLMKLAERRALANLERQVADPRLRSRLTPHYRLGCKRVLGSDTWYPALCADNVEVTTSGIARVTEDGIVDRDGRHHPVDTIILATGFQVTDPVISHRVRGRGGELLADAWQGSPKAHLGIAVAGFPNLFLLLGPNTGLGHNSVLLMIEAQIRYLLALLGHRARLGPAALEPTVAAQAGYVEQLDAAARETVWATGGCSSWYMDRTGRNSALWPGSVRAYQRRLARFDPADYLTELPRALAEPAAALA